jgi:hypothetical protein
MRYTDEGIGDFVKKMQKARKEKAEKEREKQFWKQHYASIPVSRIRGEHKMDIRNLKALALVNVLVSELSGVAKTQLVRFIKEADEVQLMAFLMDSEIMLLDEAAAEVVEDRFAQFVDEHYYDLLEAPLALADFVEEAG